MNAFEELPFVFFKAIDFAVNRWISLDENAVNELDSLDGKVIDLLVADLDICCRIYVNDGQLTIKKPDGTDADTTIKTDTATLISMARNRGKEQALTGKLEISGEIDTGHRFKSILDKIDIDWEEHLSRITGDVLARRATLAHQSVKQWLEQLADSTLRSTADYLTEEKRLLANYLEISEFNQQVDRIRNDVERLEARVQRLATG